MSDKDSDKEACERDFKAKARDAAAERRDHMELPIEARKLFSHLDRQDAEQDRIASSRDREDARKDREEGGD